MDPYPRRARSLTRVRPLMGSRGGQRSTRRESLHALSLSSPGSFYAMNRFRAKREQLERVSGPSPASRGQNMALTVLYVPSLLDSGDRACPSTNSACLGTCLYPALACTPRPRAGSEKILSLSLSLFLSLSLSLWFSLSLSLSLFLSLSLSIQGHTYPPAELPSPTAIPETQNDIFWIPVLNSEFTIEDASFCQPRQTYSVETAVCV